MARRPNDRPARPLGKRLIASLLAVTLATTPLVEPPRRPQRRDAGDVQRPGRAGQRHHARRIPRPGDEPLHRRQPDDARPGPQLSAGHRPAAQPARRLRRHRPLRRRVLLHQQAAVHRAAAEHRRQRRGLRLQAGAAVDLARHRQAAHRAAGPDQQDQRDEHQLLRSRAGAGERRGGRVRQLGDERLRQHLPVPRQRLRPGRGPAHLRHQRAGRREDRRQQRRPQRAQRHLRQGQRHLARAQPGGRQHQPAGEGADHERDRHRDPVPARRRRQRRHAALRRAHHRGPARPAARPRRLGHGGQRRHRGVCLRRARRVPEPDAHHRLGQALHAPGVGAAAPHVRQHRHAQPADAGRHRLRQQHHRAGLQDAVGRQRRAGIEHRRDADRDLQGRDRARLRGDLPQPRHPPGHERPVAGAQAHRHRAAVHRRDPSRTPRKPSANSSPRSRPPTPRCARSPR